MTAETPWPIFVQTEDTVRMGRGQTGSETLGAYSGPGHVKHMGGDKAQIVVCVLEVYFEACRSDGRNRLWRTVLRMQRTVRTGCRWVKGHMGSEEALEVYSGHVRCTGGDKLQAVACARAGGGDEAMRVRSGHWEHTGSMSDAREVTKHELWLVCVQVVVMR